jgi:acetyltransferase-like isoleucine patch superfamily enzyme
MLLEFAFHYRLHPTAKIGFSLVLPERLQMGPHSYIGHLTIVKGLEELRLGSHARLGSLNWVTGFPKTRADYFSSQPGRSPSLIINAHAAVLNRNLIDCTDSITIGEFSLVAGWWHQLLTHSIDLRTSNQSAAPITIGRYCFIGTGAILLKGSRLPDYSVLAAGSVLHKAHQEPGWLYSGCPAAAVKKLDRTLSFFVREKGMSD